MSDRVDCQHLRRVESQRLHVRGPVDLELSAESLSKFGLVSLFIMEKQMLMSAALRYLLTVVLLLLVTCRSPLVRSSLAASNALHNLGDFTYHYGTIFSPLLKALSEHGGSTWNPGLKRKMKPEHRYMKYLTEVYKKSSRVQGGLDGNTIYNTVRLIKPQDECLAQSNNESFMQDLSYSLDQVRRKEQLLKSALLYNFGHDCAAPVNSVCYLSIKEQEHSNQCQLCPEVHHAVNFTASSNGRSSWNWVEVDVTSFLQPLLKFQKKNIHLLINVTCPEEQRARGNGCKSPLKFTLRSPPLLLYLNDTSKIGHQMLLVNAKAGQEPATAANTVHKQMVFKADQRIGRKRRGKRGSSKSKRGDKSLDIHLPELLPSSEFPTSDCALYDFRVRFSQLKLDHWIVFPPKYNPRYCRGICPRTMGFIYGSPVHTMVQNIIYEKLDSSVPRPSCIPSHYSPLSVMIFEEDGSYVYKEFEDMVATRCTCR
ncbi:growth/differentiation factor 9 [Siniperca chuatsi]|uniref:growth/differentiation factor 9 n=1 Tax=Siniperca chuatsi TaxID=119488 RepID=UPI001CE2304E|nr:growth/differentiation factor 9 [Siniperca chuatsi]